MNDAFSAKPRIVVQLGRLGDLINILPAIQEEARNGRRCTIMAARQFAEPIHAGVSYCDWIFYEGDYTRLEPAIAEARKIDPAARVSQVWAHDYKHVRKTESFQRDSWVRIGAGHRWEQLSLCFDRRDAEREAELVAQYDFSKPVVLVNLSGHSSPFVSAEIFLRDVTAGLPEFNVVDISKIRASNFFDLLGLFDKAHCLITIDTATLHLAQASSVPVVALVSPHGWVSSLRRSNHLLRVPYPKVDTNCVIAAVQSTLFRVGKLIHTYADYVGSEDDSRRRRVAEASWAEARRGEGWAVKPIWYEGVLPRNSRIQLSDTRAVPFVKDMIDYAFKDSAPDDCVVFTNSDVGMVPGIELNLRRLLACKGAVYGYRWDFSNRLEEPIGFYKTTGGQWFGGLDIFAFTKSWWETHRDEAPDMVVGSTHWDLVYRDLVKKRGGGELYCGIWHELHGSYWKAHPNTAGNRHNINLANHWSMLNDTTKPFSKL